MKEREHHLLGVGGNNLGFKRAWHVLFKPLHQLVLCLRGVHKNCTFVHCDHPAQDALPLLLH
jgi:hypothetical protein